MLTDAAIRALKPRATLYRVADRDGLCLEITPRGAKHWRYRYRWAGKARMISLGTYPVITLGMARDRHLEARRQLANGIDPVQARRAAERATVEVEDGRFPVFAANWLVEREKVVKPRTLDKMTAILEKDLVPALRHANIASLTTPEAMRALQPIIERAPHMAIKAVGYLNDMIDKAIKDGVREDGKTLRGSTPKSRTVVKELRTSDLAWRPSAASSGCGTARCIRTHRTLRHRVSDTSCGRPARA